jgi:hypothetical protein
MRAGELRERGQKLMRACVPSVAYLRDSERRGLGTAPYELTALEARQAELARQAAAPPVPPVVIHPNASEIYRKKVADLHAALAEAGSRAGACEALRGLIEEIRVTPEGDGNSVELVGSWRRCCAYWAAKTPPPWGKRRVRYCWLQGPATTDSIRSVSCCRFTSRTRSGLDLLLTAPTRLRIYAWVGWPEALRAASRKLSLWVGWA